MRSLQEMCLDAILLSDDRQIVRDAWNYLPSMVLGLLDERYLQMQHTKKYKRHFRKMKRLNF
jgi:hypothetical protein